jgi:hypothetical protein
MTVQILFPSRYSPPFAAKIIYCSTILHNIIRLHNIIDEDVVVVIEEDDFDHGAVEDEYQVFQQGIQTRNNLINNVFGV